MMKRFCLMFLLLFLMFAELSTADEKPPAEEKVFSGPQPGELLSPFVVRGVFDDDAGKDLDFVRQANGRPLVLVFVHDLNRPSVSLTRLLTQYTVSRDADKLSTGIILLTDDATEGENTLRRIRHALAERAPVGVSPDGLEGPGSYGLNRKVTLTILIAKDGRVTHNFALIQPSIQADLPGILEAVVSVAGGKIPRLEDLEGMRDQIRPSASSDQIPNLRPLLAPVIRRDATPEDVDRAAKAVEELAGTNSAAAKEVGRIANTIIDAGKLSEYGTPRAREYLQKWAMKYGKSTKKPADAPKEKE